MDSKNEIKLIDKYYNNPITKNFLSVIRMISPIGDLIDTNINIVIDRFTKEKQDEFVNTILQKENLLTTDDVNDIEFIMNFKKTLEAVNRLSNNDKIKYFANLLSNGYLTGKHIKNDSYEEMLEVLSSLTNEQINYLVFLYKFEKINDVKANDYWYKFIQAFEKEFNIDKYKSWEIYKRIENKGLLYEELKLESKTVIERNNNEENDELLSGNLELQCFTTTDFLNKLIELIMN